MNCNRTSNIKGFTLLEVLVAFVILISAISISTVSFRGSILSSHKAVQNIEIYAQTESIINLVKSEIRHLSIETNEVLLGKGQQGSILYSWRAELIKYESAPRTFRNGEFYTPEKRFKLWNVSLTLSAGAFEKSVKYKELGWGYE